MAESRKCEHGQMKGSCDLCYIGFLEKDVTLCREHAINLTITLNAEVAAHKVTEQEYRAIINRLQDRIDTLNRQRNSLFCQLVKRRLKLYSEATFKLLRRLIEAYRNHS